MKPVSMNYDGRKETSAERRARRAAYRAQRRPRRLSTVFTEIAETADGPVSIGMIIDALGDRSFAALLLFFAAINLLPLPPGASLILGAPMILVTAQMTWGARRVWMPRSVRERTLTAEQFRAAIAWAAPKLRGLEQWIRPRYWPFWRRQGERIVGTIALVLSVVVAMPIPLGNWLPALSVAILALALTERDGLLLAIGTAVGIVALFVVTAVVGSAAVLASMIWANLFSTF
jgi:hypothetical protein